MTLLITGGTGFVLSNLTRLWLETDTTASVIVLDSAPWDAAAERFFAPVRDRLKFVQGDVLDQATWGGLSALQSEITHVVHGATITPGDERERTEARQISYVNTIGTVNALEWARTLPGLRRFIYVSSGSVYSETDPPLPDAPVLETDAIEPDGLYGISKYASELFTRRYGEMFGLDTASVRFSTVYGPMDRSTPARTRFSAPYRLIHAALAGKPIRVASLQAGGDWIHAHDVARALVALLRAGQIKHTVYNVAYGEWLSLGQLAAIIQEIVPGFQCSVAPASEADITNDPANRLGRWSAYDISRLRDEFGWQPRPIREALHMYIAWLRENERVGDRVTN